MNSESVMFLCIMVLLIAAHECRMYVGRGNKTYYMFCILYYKHLQFVRNNMFFSLIS